MRAYILCMHNILHAVNTCCCCFSLPDLHAGQIFHQLLSLFLQLFMNWERKRGFYNEGEDNITSSRTFNQGWGKKLWRPYCWFMALCKWHISWEPSRFSGKNQRPRSSGFPLCPKSGWFWLYKSFLHNK